MWGAGSAAEDEGQWMRSWVTGSPQHTTSRASTLDGLKTYCKVTLGQTNPIFLSYTAATLSNTEHGVFLCCLVKDARPFSFFIETRFLLHA